MPEQEKNISKLLVLLTGQDCPLDPPKYLEKNPFQGGKQLGYSQLNELLLLHGFDRVTHAFYRYLVDGETAYDAVKVLTSYRQFEEGVERFRKIAILLYGNVKFGFKELSRNSERFLATLTSLEQCPDSKYTERHAPLIQLEKIDPNDSYLTGYLIEREIHSRLQENPEDEEAKQLDKKRREIVEKAEKNHEAYLASDHLDVYVATSMREKHEFVSISNLAREIFENELLEPLKLRWFDPTQAVCSDRIDKGLSEALMLRRAQCTIYLAQESDTLGKDSELASTLAQGKPVIAFLPAIDEDYFENHLKVLQSSDTEMDFNEILVSQLKIYAPYLAWSDDEKHNWFLDPKAVDPEKARQLLFQKMREHYDKRADTLKNRHPLGIQVMLETGVANGVLVTRTVEECAQLLKKILTNSLEFELSEHEAYTALVEKSSGCIFRVMTKDRMLTNTFWNFYIDPAE